MASGSDAWTGDRIVAGIQAWAARTGEPPSASAWLADASPATRPTAQRVIRVFGSWSEAIAAAGSCHANKAADGSAVELPVSPPLVTQRRRDRRLTHSGKPGAKPSHRKCRRLPAPGGDGRIGSAASSIRARALVGQRHTPPRGSRPEAQGKPKGGNNYVPTRLAATRPGDGPTSRLPALQGRTRPAVPRQKRATSRQPPRTDRADSGRRKRCPVLRRRSRPRAWFRSSGVGPAACTASGTCRFS
jgi:hypothetical protein